MVCIVVADEASSPVTVFTPHSFTSPQFRNGPAAPRSSNWWFDRRHAALIESEAHQTPSPNPNKISMQIKSQVNIGFPPVIPVAFCSTAETLKL